MGYSSYLKARLHWAYLGAMVLTIPTIFFWAATSQLNPGPVLVVIAFASFLLYFTLGIGVASLLYLVSSR